VTRRPAETARKVKDFQEVARKARRDPRRTKGATAQCQKELDAREDAETAHQQMKALKEQA